MHKMAYFNPNLNRIQNIEKEQEQEQNQKKEYICYKANVKIQEVKMKLANKIKDKFMPVQKKKEILNKLRNDELSIEDIQYLTLEGLSGNYTKTGANQEYIFIDSFLYYVRHKQWLQKLKHEGVNVGVFCKSNLKIENGVCEHKYTIEKADWL